MISQTDVSQYIERVGKWLMNCFGESESKSVKGRAHRYIEESLELAQAIGVTKKEVLDLVDYTFSRPIGETEQEVGGVAVTLSGLMFALGVDLERCAMRELSRIETRDVMENLARKHKSSVPGSSLPGTL